jgi:hypothetical protein
VGLVLASNDKGFGFGFIFVPVAGLTLSGLKRNCKLQVYQICLRLLGGDRDSSATTATEDLPNRRFN